MEPQNNPIVIRNRVYTFPDHLIKLNESTSGNIQIRHLFVLWQYYLIISGVNLPVLVIRDLRKFSTSIPPDQVGSRFKAGTALLECCIVFIITVTGI